MEVETIADENLVFAYYLRGTNHNTVAFSQSVCLVCLFIFHPFLQSLPFHFTASSGVIVVLVNSGRQIDAVNLAFAFELTEQFSPVPLLKSYLKEARKASSPVKVGNTSPNAEVQFLLSTDVFLSNMMYPISLLLCSYISNWEVT